MSTRKTGCEEADSVASGAAHGGTHGAPHRYVRPKEAAKKLGIGISTLWLKIKHDPDFPQPIKLGPNTTVLVEHEIDRYVYTRSRHAR